MKGLFLSQAGYNSSNPTTPSEQELSEQSDSNLVEFIDELQKIDTDGPLAQLNEISISDNNGGRIEL